jgi:hypothetical protein
VGHRDAHGGRYKSSVGALSDDVKNESETLMRDWNTVVEQFVLGRLTETGGAAIGVDVTECGRDSVGIAKLIGHIAEFNDVRWPYECTEQRRHARIDTDERATMRLISPMVLEFSEIRIVNVSLGGLMLRTERRLTPGTIIQIRVKGTFILAEVRHASLKDDGYYVGVRVQDLLTVPQ